MWMVNWFSDVIASLGMVNKKAKIAFLGLGNAGKTTVFHMLQNERVAVFNPSSFPMSEELSIGGNTWKTYDLGGNEQARDIWRREFSDFNAVIFIVDANDRDRFPDAKFQLEALLSEAQNIPFAVLGNKIDRSDAVSEDQLRSAMGNPHTTGKGKVPLQGTRAIEVFMCSAVMRQGHVDALRWISQYV